MHVLRDELPRGLLVRMSGDVVREAAVDLALDGLAVLEVGFGVLGEELLLLLGV